MKVSINKDSNVPIRDQLIEQIGLQIAAGSLKGEERLPSVRALANRLGIHYNTVSSAYSHLADIGLLQIRQGSGVKVVGRLAHKELDLAGSSLDELLYHFLAVASEHGYSRCDIEESVKRVLNNSPIERVLVVDRNPDFHPLLYSELQPHFSMSVEAVTPNELRERIFLASSSLVVTSLYHIFALRDLRLDPTRLVVCNVEPGRLEQEAVLKLPPGSLLLLVSVSPTLLKMATNVMSALRGTEVGIRTISPLDEQELQYTLKYADLIICDQSSKDVTMRLSGQKAVSVFRLYSPSTIKLVQERIKKWG